MVMKKFSHVMLAMMLVLLGTTNYMGVAAAQAQGKIPSAPKTTTTLLTPFTPTIVNELGPFGGTINSLVMDPSTPTTLYAASNYGVFKSVNNGDNWSITTLTGKLVLALAINPQNPSNIFAATSAQGFYYSTDGGLTWTASPDAYIQDKIVYTLVVDPVNPNNLYAGGRELNVDGSSSGNWGGGAFKSTNGGVSWQAINNGLPEGWVYSMLVNPSVPNIIYAGTHTQGVWKSYDGGATWYSRNGSGSTALTGDNLKIRSLAMSPLHPDVIFAALWAGNGLWETDNGGENGWQYAAHNLSNAPIRSVAVDPIHPNLVYAGLFNGGPLMNVNGGVTTNWGPFPTQPQGPWGYFSNINSIVVNPQNDAIIFFGALGAGVFRTTDGGIHWQAVNQGLSATSVTSIVADPANPTTMYASTNGSGLFKSTDNGTTWSLKLWPNPPLDYVLSVTVDPLNSNTLYIPTVNNGILASYDDGATWYNIQNNLPTTSGSPIATAFTVSATYPTSTLYAGTWGHGIYQSTDSGISWHLVDAGNAQITSLQVYPGDPTSIMASSANSGVIFVISSGGVNSYRISTNGLPSYDVLSILIDPSTFGTLYAGTMNGVYITNNNGSLWSYYGLSNDQINAMTMDPNRKSTFFAGTQVDGLLRTDDAGATWSSAGVAGGSISSLLIKTTPTLQTFLFVGLDGAGAIQAGYSKLVMSFFIREPVTTR